MLQVQCAMLYKNKTFLFKPKGYLTVLLGTTTEKWAIPYLATSAVILKGKRNTWGFSEAYQNSELKESVRFISFRRTLFILPVNIHFVESCRFPQLNCLRWHHLSQFEATSLQIWGCGLRKKWGLFLLSAWDLQLKAKLAAQCISTRNADASVVGQVALWVT